ncbi:MAG: hypothetical protein JWO22_3686, partial [Frankiales bacterium]|nr:hypothetical protein [Frankiales bacterium]
PALPAAVEPPPLVEPTVLNASSPLDSGWLPPELPEVPAPEPVDEVEADEEPVAEQAGDEVGWDDSPHDDGDAWDDSTTAYAEPEEGYGYEDTAEPGPATDAGQDWFRGLVDTGSAEAVAEDMPYETPEPVEPAGPRPPYEGQRVSPGRAVLGAGVALLGVLLAIGSLIFLNGNDEPKGGPVVSSPPLVSTKPSPSPSTPAVTTSTSPAPVVAPTSAAPTSAAPAEAAIVPVRVLNNSKIKGLADRAAARFRSGGWPVPQTGNYRGGTISTTTVYYAPGQQASAARFAKQFGIPRVAPRFAGIPVPGMTVIVTRDYQP